MKLIHLSTTLLNTQLNMENQDGQADRVLVWRESVGFEEYGAFVSKEGGKTERVNSLSADSINFKVQLSLMQSGARTTTSLVRMFPSPSTS